MVTPPSTENVSWTRYVFSGDIMRSSEPRSGFPSSIGAHRADNSGDASLVDVGHRGSSIHSAVARLENPLFFSGYCIRRNGISYFLDESKWQKFRSLLTWEQRWNLQLQTFKAFNEQCEPAGIDWDYDNKLLVNFKETVSLLPPSEMAKCSIISANF